MICLRLGGEEPPAREPEYKAEIDRRIVSSNIPSLVVTSHCCSIPSGATATAGDRGFESISLRRRVTCEPDFRLPSRSGPTHSFEFQPGGLGWTLRSR